MSWAFLQLNPGTVGVYRVNYGTETLERLIAGIRDMSLPPRDRLGIQNDLFALVSHTNLKIGDSRVSTSLGPRSVDPVLRP